MASLKALIGDTVGKLLFPEWTITRIGEVSPHFRRIELGGDELRGSGPAAGDKVQLMVSGLGSRTYTPFNHDRERGTVELLTYLHGEGPGAAWGRQAAVGGRVRVFGPRGSLPLARLSPTVVLFGDETSFAVGRALCDLHGAAGRIVCVFEVTDREESALALAELGLRAELVQRGGEHLGEVEARLRAALGPTVDLVLTGNARSIQALRAAIKARPVEHRGQKVKAYWAAGKRGLD